MFPFLFTSHQEKGGNYNREVEFRRRSFVCQDLKGILCLVCFHEHFHPLFFVDHFCEQICGVCHSATPRWFH